MEGCSTTEQNLDCTGLMFWARWTGEEIWSHKNTQWPFLRPKMFCVTRLNKGECPGLSKEDEQRGMPRFEQRGWTKRNAHVWTKRNAQVWTKRMDRKECTGLSKDDEQRGMHTSEQRGMPRFEQRGWTKRNAQVWTKRMNKEECTRLNKEDEQRGMPRFEQRGWTKRNAQVWTKRNAQYCRLIANRVVVIQRGAYTQLRHISFCGALSTVFHAWMPAWVWRLQVVQIGTPMITM